MTGLRRFIAISLVVFPVAVFYILLVGLLPGCGGGGDDSGGPPAAAQTPGQPTVTGSTTISAQEVAMHNSPDDCWIIISNKVYDVSSYIKLHPGGSDTIMPYCGEEATHAFETKDLSREEDHSGFAYSHLDSLYVGDLGG